MKSLFITIAGGGGRRGPGIVEESRISPRARSG
jgi:hypothetical protein